MTEVEGQMQRVPSTMSFWFLPEKTVVMVTILVADSRRR
jgi:hypothetical protein